MGFSSPISVVVYTRDLHPPNHCSFIDRGGPWPPHCVAGTWGAEFAPALPVIPDAHVVAKGQAPDRDAYSGFDGTGLADWLRQRQVRSCLVTGLATEYCVKATALDALQAGLDTWVVTDGIAPVERVPGDADRALLEMRQKGACLTDSGQARTILAHHHPRFAWLIVDVQNDFCPGGALPVALAPAIFAAHRALATMTRPVRWTQRLLGHEAR